MTATSISRYAGAIGALIACIFGAILAARVGVSRLLSEYGSSADSLAAAEHALRFNAADPEAHYSHAIRLAEVGRNDEAIAEFERAASLRPQDYFLWQELGRARDDNGDGKGAVAALRRAISRAPYYSQPHWQLGNVLLREHQLNEAVQELRSAVLSDPSLCPAFIDLAWNVCDGDAECVLAVTQPQTGEERISLSRFFVTHNRIEAGLRLVAANAVIAPEDRGALVVALIVAGRLQEAHDLWIANVRGHVTNPIFDGGFEAAIDSDEPGFGWRPIQSTQTVHIALDTEEPYSGKQSLRLEYSGNSDPTVPIVSQLVLVAPSARYRLTFAARTQDLVSGGLPNVTVSGVTDHRVLAQSRLLPSGTTDWRDFSIDFETTNTSAVTINVQRQVCSSHPCPIFGRAWFDDFALQPLSR